MAVPQAGVRLSVREACDREAGGGATGLEGTSLSTWGDGTGPRGAGRGLGGGRCRLRSESAHPPQGSVREAGWARPSLGRARGPGARPARPRAGGSCRWWSTSGRSTDRGGKRDRSSDCTVRGLLGASPPALRRFSLSVGEINCQCRASQGAAGAWPHHPGNKAEAAGAPPSSSLQLTGQRVLAGAAPGKPVPLAGVRPPTPWCRTSR